MQKYGWAIAPLVAVAAYGSVLRIGFLSDDLVMLWTVRESGISLKALLPNAYWPFYRPVGGFLTWQLGWQLWGFNPFPYHLLGLLIHAGVCLVLALWIAEVTGRPGLGRLCGVVFAVFPLHLEAVGWLSAQWDSWAVLFALLSVWLFTAWWRGKRAYGGYLLALLFYLVGLFTKESLLAFLPVFGLSAWAAAPPATRAERRRLGLGLLPFAGVLGLHIGARFLALGWGNLGGYKGMHLDAESLFRSLEAFGQVLLAPINTSLFGGAAAWVVGLVSGIGLLVGLAWTGRAYWRVVVLAAGWVLCGLLPVLSLPPKTDDLQQNRYLYLAAVGYCVLAATLLYGLIARAGRGRRPALGLVGVLLAVSGAVCWAQLYPWYIATQQVDAIRQELRRMIPPQSYPHGLIWYVEPGNPPDNYKGAYVLRLGLDRMRFFDDGEVLWLRQTPDAKNVPLNSRPEAAFGLRFGYDAGEARYHVDYAGGVTDGGPPPALAPGGVLWDFWDCAPATLGRWRAVQGETSCEPGKGLSAGPGTHIVGRGLAVAAQGGRFLRLRVGARYPAGIVQGQTSRWFWAMQGVGWSTEHSAGLPARQDGATHIYWTFVPATDLGAGKIDLRFDPGTAGGPASLAWIALEPMR